MLNQTSFDQFRSAVESALRAGKKIVTVVREILGDFITPVAAYQALRTHLGSAILESVSYDKEQGRYSIIGVNPFARYEISDGEGTVEYLDAGYSPFRKNPTQSFSNPLEGMEKLLKQYSPEKSRGFFTGGAIGFFGHEAICMLEPTVPRNQDVELNLPDAWFQFFKHILVFDHASQTLYLTVNAPLEHLRPTNHNKPEEVYLNALTDLDLLECELRKAAISDDIPGCSCIDIRSNLTDAEVEAMVGNAKKYIASGDVFQVVLSQRFQTPFPAERSLDFYRLLRRANPSPYLFHIDISDGVILAGASPEVMVRVKGRQMLIRPLAGTRPRGKTQFEDEIQAKNLASNEKEIAEHNMLVDLVRNDVGKYCNAGSVKVEGLKRVEVYGAVLHMVTDVRGQLKTNVKLLEAVLGSLPAGTLSGAPKVRALQIIAELEPSCRGPYGGAVGWLTDEDADTCILIRSGVLCNGMLYWQTGAGIVADSVAADEFKEMMDKSISIRKVLELMKKFSGEAK